MKMNISIATNRNFELEIPDDIKEINKKKAVEYIAAIFPPLPDGRDDVVPNSGSIFSPDAWGRLAAACREADCWELSWSAIWVSEYLRGEGGEILLAHAAARIAACEFVERAWATWGTASPHTGNRGGSKMAAMAAISKVLAGDTPPERAAGDPYRLVRYREVSCP